MLWNLCEKDVNFINAMFEDLIEEMKLYGIRQYVNEGTVVCDVRLKNDDDDDDHYQEGISFMAYIQVIVYGVRERFNRLSPLFYVSDIDKIN